MKNLPTKGTLILAACLLFLLATPSFAFEEVTAKIPFTFLVGNTSHPAGEYTFEWQDTDTKNTIDFRSKDGKYRGLAVAELIEAPEAAKATLLSFQKVGDQRYLRKIEAEGESEVAEVVLPKALTDDETAGTKKPDLELVRAHHSARHHGK